MKKPARNEPDGQKLKPMNTKLIARLDLSKIHLKGTIKALTGIRRIKVTPELAEQWLKLNTFNRPPSRGFIKDLASRMARGEWMLNGQCIVFLNDGRLGDGQHRLLAVVEYGQPVMFDVMFGISPEAFATMDDGRKRTAGDVLAIHDIPNYTNTSAAIRKIIAYQSNDKNRSTVSNQQVLSWYYDNPEIAECVTLAVKWYDISGRILTVSEYAYYYYLMSCIDEDLAGHFMDKLAVGSNLSTSSPIFKLRAKLMQSKVDRLKRLVPSVRHAYIVKTWNYVRKGRTVKVLKFDPSFEETPVLE